MLRNRAKDATAPLVSTFFFPKVKIFSLLNKTQTFLVKKFSTRREEIDFFNGNHVDHIHSQTPFIANNHKIPSNEFYRRDGDCLGLQQTWENGYLRNHENQKGDYVNYANAFGENSRMFEQNSYRYDKQNNVGAQQYSYSNPYMGMTKEFDDFCKQYSYSNPYEGMIKEFDDFCKRNELEKAMEVLKVLERKGVILVLPRYELLMKMCGEVGHLQYAKDVHVYLMRSKQQIPVSFFNKILVMYFKCDSAIDAYEVFRNMPDCDTTSWETMIRGFAKEGLGEEAIDLFTEFLDADSRPDGHMFMAVFFACSVLCDIDEGILHFKLMKDVYGIVPSMEHYLSVIDMLGSVGYLDEAMEFIGNMPFVPSVDVWETMMNLCRVHGNTVLGDHCTGIVRYLDPSRLTDESEKGLLSGKATNTALNKESRLLSSRNSEKGVYEFTAGDTSHPETDIIYAILREMREHMKEVGYVPDTRFTMHDIEQEEKEECLLTQSERLAVANGLIETRARTPIRIVRNFRLCLESHTALKIISKIVGRKLIIRDAKRFHYIQNSFCSCNNFW